jgi:SM-20-related protein
MTDLTEYLVSQLRGAALVEDPWRYAYIENTLPLAVARNVGASFPRVDLNRQEEIRDDKSYRFGTRKLYGDGADPIDGVEWAAVVEALTSQQYRSAMSALSSIPLMDAALEINVWEYENGDWLAPHVDKPGKVVTQIFYFTDGWQEGHGGRLMILASEDEQRVSATIPPTMGASAVLIRSESSWHAVEAPVIGAPVRRSITATFWRGDTQ